jgi:hypothetical protein
MLKSGSLEIAWRILVTSLFIERCPLFFLAQSLRIDKAISRLELRRMGTLLAYHALRQRDPKICAKL